MKFASALVLIIGTLIAIAFYILQSDIFIKEKQKPGHNVLSGTITNLDGKISITVNSIEETTIRPDDKKKFIWMVPDETLYEIEITEQPPGQDCTISSNGSGFIYEEDITDVQIICRDNQKETKK